MGYFKGFSRMTNVHTLRRNTEVGIGQKKMNPAETQRTPRVFKGEGRRTLDSLCGLRVSAVEI